VIDGFVNNAGVYHEAPIWEEDPERIRRTIEVNLLGAVNCSIFAARAMGDGGSIVNSSSGGTFGLPTAVTDRSARCCSIRGRAPGAGTA
jgi:NAD(P)-dependent dehydrogenase (short-subunit alcohol dehydrogenase family)